MTGVTPKPGRAAWHARGFLFDGNVILAYTTLAICQTLALARAVFKVAVEEKPAGRLMIRNRTRVVKRHPEGDW